MSKSNSILIIGASCRAAADSALRAGIVPYCIDQFGDADLVARCSWAHWDRLPGAAVVAPPGPWMYTGGVENRPGLVRLITRHRPLWGNDSSVLTRVRSPWWLTEAMRAAQLNFPELRTLDAPPPDGAWLVKPSKGSGGRNIRWYSREITAGIRRGRYLQRFVSGDSISASYASDGHRVTLLGAARQMVGTPWLHAAPFHYCGSIGLMRLEGELLSALVKIGQTLAVVGGMKGLFGVDLIIDQNTAWVIEVNPRYTASMEVLERATGTSMFGVHRAMFSGESYSVGGAGARVFGKAVLFAKQPIEFPAQGPWMESSDPPRFADIPRAGHSIPAGAPVLSFFAAADSDVECLNQLQEMATDLDQWLY